MAKRSRWPTVRWWRATWMPYFAVQTPRMLPSWSWGTPSGEGDLCHASLPPWSLHCRTLHAWSRAAPQRCAAACFFQRLIVSLLHRATTHTDLQLRARALNIPVRVIHNASVMNAVGACGLQLYRFGEVRTLRAWVTHIRLRERA